MRKRNRAVDSVAFCSRVAGGEPVSFADGLTAALTAATIWWWCAVTFAAAALLIEAVLSLSWPHRVWTLFPSFVLVVCAAVAMFEFVATTTRARVFRSRAARPAKMRAATLAGRFDFWVALVVGVLVGGLLSLVALASVAQ